MASGEVNLDNLESPQSDEDYLSLSSDSDIDPENAALEMLNFRSKNFNAELVLKCATSEINVPFKKAPVYLNLQQYEIAIKDPINARPLSSKTVKELAQKNLPTKDGATENEEGKQSVGSEEPHYPMPGRRFLPHQMPVFRPRKKHPNTLTLMKETEGPLSRLAKVIDEKTKIKVWTRNASGIRGFCVGYLEAFDKHWNLAMKDVDERFQRKKVIKYPAECKESDDSPPKQLQKSKDILPSKTKKLLKELFEDCENKRVRKPKIPSTGKITKRVMLETQNTVDVLRLELNLLSLSDNVTKPELGAGSSVAESRQRLPLESTCPVTDEKLEDQKITSSDLCAKSLPSKSQIKKNSWTVFQESSKDPNGFSLIAKNKNYEILERHVGQLFLMGNDVVFIEILT